MIDEKKIILTACQRINERYNKDRVIELNEQTKELMQMLEELQDDRRKEADREFGETCQRAPI